MGQAHAYNPDCGCPGCQFLWAAAQAYKKFGLPPIIGTFEPTIGDCGRDSERADSPRRVYTGDRWYPYFEVLPRET